MPQNITNKFRASFLEDKVALIPHHLNDNLRWQCYVCNSLVSTHETHSHLISCIEKLRKYENDRSLFPLSDHDLRTRLIFTSDIRMSKQRPRTKRLERPTPNLRHPVIENKVRIRELKDTEISVSEEDIVSHKIPSIENKKLNSTRRKVDSSVGKSPSFQSSSQKLFNKKKSMYNESPNSIESVKHHAIDNVSPTESNGEDKLESLEEMVSMKEKMKRPSRRDKIMKTNDHKSKEESNNSKEEEKKVSSSGSFDLVENLRRLSTFSIKSFTLRQESSGDKKKLIMKCYICNKQVDSNQLMAHEEKCLEGKKNEFIKNHEEKQLGTSNQKINYEKAMKSGCDPAGWEHFKSQLVPCPVCSRTFFPHRLPIHEKSCRGGNVNINASMKAQSKTPLPNKPASVTTKSSNKAISSNTIQKSIFLDCTKCKRKFSTTSITLHELKCKNSSNIMSRFKGKNDNEMEAWQQFNSQLVACAKCGRKFTGERISRHTSNCKAIPVSEKDINSKNK